MTEVIRYTITDGEHAGHHVTTDAWGIDYCGRNPKTAVWCHDCHDTLDLIDGEESSSDTTGKEPK